MSNLSVGLVLSNPHIQRPINCRIGSSPLPAPMGSVLGCILQVRRVLFSGSSRPMRTGQLRWRLSKRKGYRPRCELVTTHRRRPKPALRHTCSTCSPQHYKEAEPTARLRWRLWRARNPCHRRSPSILKPLRSCRRTDPKSHRRNRLLQLLQHPHRQRRCRSCRHLLHLRHHRGPLPKVHRSHR